MYRYVHLAVFVHVLVLFMNSMAQSQYTPLPLPLVAIWQSMINDQRSVELLNTSKFIKQRVTMRARDRKSALNSVQLRLG